MNILALLTELTVCLTLGPSQLKHELSWYKWKKRLKGVWESVQFLIFKPWKVRWNWVGYYWMLLYRKFLEGSFFRLSESLKFKTFWAHYEPPVLSNSEVKTYVRTTLARSKEIVSFDLVVWYHLHTMVHFRKTLMIIGC